MVLQNTIMTSCGHRFPFLLNGNDARRTPRQTGSLVMKSAHSSQTHSRGRQIDDGLWIPLLWIRDLCPEFIYYFAQWPLNLSASGNSISKHPANRFLSAMLLPLSEHSAQKTKDMQQIPGKDRKFTPCYLFLVVFEDDSQLSAVCVIPDSLLYFLVFVSKNMPVKNVGLLSQELIRNLNCMQIVCQNFQTISQKNLPQDSL